MLDIGATLEGDHGGVVDEAVDEGCGDHGVAEDLAPGFKAAVAGDDDRAAFVAAGDQGVVHGDATDMPFASDRFSSAVCFTMLHCAREDCSSARTAIPAGTSTSSSSTSAM